MALPPRPLSSSTGSSSMRKRREIEDIDNSNHSNSSLVCASSPAAAQIPRVSSTKAQRRLKNSLIDQGMSSSETKQNHQGSQDEKIDNGINSAVSERKMMPPSNINHGSNNVTASQVEVEKNMQIETEPTSDLRQNSNGTHANNGKPNNEKDEDAHKTQLIQMLKYRNNLLQRIRQCRDVADIQLDQSTQAVQEPKSDEISTEKSGEGMKDLSNYNDEREIDGFRKMARTAAQILKRQRPEQHAVENPRPTVTLRRGASVGKKMNAAVSSLTGNATYLTSDSSSSPTFTLPAQPLHLPSSGPTGGVNSGRSVAQPSAGLTVTNPVNSASQDAVITPSTNMHGVSIATPVSSSHHVHPPSHLGSSMNMKQNLPLPIASGDGNRKGEISSKQRRSSATTQKNKRLSIQKNMKNNSMGQTSDSGGQVSSLPLHYGLGTSVLPHPSGGVGMGKNQQQMRQGSSSPVPGRKNVVICHEAMALRKRRNTIRSKLGAVLYDQLNKIERSGKVHMAKGKTELSKSSVVPSPVTKVQRNRGVETKKNPFTWAMVNTSLRGPGAPAQLPQRRKTQWDYVLEEMRWLATDFIEERKWKGASSQTLSCAVRSRRSIPLLSKPNQRPVKKKSTDGEKQKVSILNQSAGIEELETTPSVNLVSPVSVAVPKIEYYKESKSADKAFSRMKAKLLSVMVTEHWDTVVNGGIFAASDETYATSFLRYRRLEKSIDRMVEQHSIEISGNDTLLSVEEHNDEKNDSKIDSVGKDQMDVDMNGSESDNLPSHTKDELSRTISESPSDANWSDGGNRPRSIELSHEAITKSITSSIEQIKNIRHDSDDRYRDDKAWDIWTEQLDGCGVKLNLSQLQACHLVEELWCCVNDSVDSYDFGSGAILSGSAGCGKTIAIGGMLWKQRQGGPQLVLCPPASLIRWRQSLYRYNDLNVFTFGEHGGSYDYNSVQRSQSNMLGPRDILLCEFSCFHVLLEQFGCESNSVHYSAHSKLPFSTFILDSRHQYAAGDLASMRNSKSTVSGGNLTNTKKKQSQSLGINTTGLASLELASLEWWNNLLGAVSNSGVRRLLVHRYPSNPCRPEHYFEWFPDEKQGNELLACVAAFVHNPGTFHSQNVSTSRKVASWAKRLSSSNLKGKSKNDYIRILDLDPTDPGARGVLKSTLSPVFISLINEEKNSSFGWDIRFCTLSEAQRRAYDSCCSRARGALSVSGSMDVREVLASNERPKKVEVNVNHYMLAAQALLRIRRVCLHSHIGQLLRDKLQDNSTSQSKPLCDASLELVDPSPSSMHRNHWLREKPQNVLNASQPNFLLAQEIMDHSSKMKELLTILYFECGYHFTSEEMFLSMLKEETGFRKVKDMNTARRKVVVLATLPEAQLLTSIFLNAVGIRSEVMLSDLIPEVQNAKSTVESYEGADVSSPVKGFDNRVNTKVSTDLKNRVGRYGDAIAGWVMCQTVLARFDKNTAEQGTENTGGILISSPVAVSGLHSGLDSAAGEVVISLDEDWSGREALFLSSIQTRHIARHSNKVPTVDVTHGVHFIKIISRDTCEHEFLFNEKEARRGISQVVKEKEKVRNIATRKTVRRGRSASKVESTLDSKVNSDSDRKRDKDDGFIQPFQSIRMMMTDEYGYVRTPNPHLDQSLPDEKPLKGSFLLSGESRSQLGVASNVLRYRNVKLSILLRTHEPLPADFVYGKDLRFIPYIGEGYRTGEISENANHGHNVDKMNDLMMDIRFSEALAAMEALASPLSVDSVTYNQEKHVGLLKFGGECVGKNRHGFSHLVVAVPLLPSIFPPTVVSRRDTVSIKARLYMQHFGRSLLSCASGDSLARTTCISSHQTEPLFLRSTPAAQGDAGINNAGIDLAEGWRRSGLSCKVNDIAASFLVYKLPRSPFGTRGVKRSIDYGALEDRDIVESHDKKQAADHALDSTLESCGDEVHVSWKKQRQLNGKCDRFDFDLMSNGNGQRSNVYSISFGASQEARSLLVRDGNVGCEPLLYFPPLFPGMRQCSQQVSLDLDYLSIDSRAGREPRDTSTEATQLVDIQPSMMSSSDQTRKRSHYATNPPSSGKRPRVSTLSNFQSTGVGTSVSHTPAHSYQPAPMTGSLYSESRTEHNDPNSIPKLIEPGIITEDEVSESDAASMLVKLNDDFGLVGLGALPHALDSAKAAASVPIETASYRQWDFHGHSDPSQTDVLSGFCVCDSEEVEMTNYSREQNLCLQGMLLFVKKRSPSVAMRRTPASFHHQGVLPAASSPFISESLQLSVGAPGNSNAGVRYFEGSESMRNSNKKTKKNQQHSGHTAVSAYPPLIHAADVKDGYRNYSSVNSTNYQGKGSGRKFTSAGAYFSTGTMRQNETLSVRLAIVRIRQQISNHVSFKLSTASQPGPGVPLLLENRVASPASNLTPTTHLGTSTGICRSGRPVCAVLKLSSTSKQTGDFAQSESITQREALRRSMIAPCRVDFGPFQSGFLSSARGMTGISPPRSRVGITLPMGVKLPQRQKEHGKQDLNTSLEPWNTFEDQKLKECIQQFGLNWHLASRYLTGDFDNKYNPNHEHTGHMRSARQCSERWKILARRDTSISIDFRVHEHKMRDMSRMTVSQIVDSLNSVHQKSINNSVLLSTGFQKKTDRLSNSLKHENVNAADGNNLILSRLKRMSLLKMASTKKQEVHITIPGYVSGTLPDTPTHKSHMQSIQSALSTSTGPGGIIPPRAEMWPLQLLELADDQFAANVAAAEKAKQEAAAARSQQSSSSSIRRQQVSGVAHSNQSQATAAYRHQHQQLSQSKQTAPVSSATQSQQELIKQAARAAAMGSSSSSGRSASRGGNAGTSSQHQASYPAPQQHNHHPAPVVAAPAISPAATSSSATPEVKAAALAAALGKPKSQNAPQSS